MLRFLRCASVLFDAVDGSHTIRIDKTAHQGSRRRRLGGMGRPLFFLIEPEKIVIVLPPLSARGPVYEEDDVGGKHCPRA
jgi:hypothetical protein